MPSSPYRICKLYHTLEEASSGAVCVGHAPWGNPSKYLLSKLSSKLGISFHASLLMQLHPSCSKPLQRCFKQSEELIIRNNLSSSYSVHRLPQNLSFSQIGPKLNSSSVFKGIIHPYYPWSSPKISLDSMDHTLAQTRRRIPSESTYLTPKFYSLPSLSWETSR